MKVLKALPFFYSTCALKKVHPQGAFADPERARMTALKENIELKNTIMKLREDISTFERKSILLEGMLEANKAESEVSKLYISEMQTRQGQFEAENYSLKQEASISIRKLEEYNEEVETLRERVASIAAKVESTLSPQTGALPGIILY